MDFADGLYIRQMYDMAAAEYAKYIEMVGDGPGTEVARFRMAECQYHTGQYSTAAETIATMLTKFPDGEKRAPAMLRLGEIQYRLGDFDQSVATLERALADELDDALAATGLYYLGKALFAAGETSKSISTFHRLIDDFPENALVPYGTFALAVDYFEVEEYEKAARFFAEVGDNETVPTAVRAEAMLKSGMAYGSSGHYDLAATAFENLLTRFPSSRVAEQAQYERAWAAYHSGSFKQAAELADEFVEQRPEGTWTVGAHYLKGRCLQSLGKYSDAETVFEEICTNHPSSLFAARAKSQLCWSAYWQHRLDETVARAEALLDSDEAGDLRGDILFVYGLAQFDQGRFAEALDQFDAVLDGYPRGKFAPEAEFHRARCMAKLGRHADAAGAFAQFAASRPANSLADQARFNAAQQEFLAGNYTQAATGFATLAGSAADNTTRSNALFMQGQANEKADKPEAAVAAYSQYVAVAPQGPNAAEALYRVGVLQQQQKDTGRAVATYERLIAGYPDSRFALRASRNLGHIHYAEGELSAAAERFVGLLDSADLADLFQPETLMWLGNYLYAREDYATARVAYERYAEMQVSETKELFGRVRAADCAFNSGDTSSAETIYRSVIDAAPDGPYSVIAELGLGRLLLAAGNIGKATEKLNHVVEVGNSSAVAEARSLLGDAYAQIEDYDEALRSYMMVAMVYDHPDLSPECYIKAADILQKQRKPDQAQKLYQDLIAAYPDSDAADTARARVGSAADGE